MYCHYCGKENINEANYCSTCGRLIVDSSTIENENTNKGNINNHQKTNTKWIIILVATVILIVLVLMISLPRRQENISTDKNAINSSNKIPLLQDDNIGFSLDTVNGYQALNTKIPRHDCEIRTFEDKQPYYSIKKSLDERFGNGIKGTFFIFDYLHWKDQSNKNLYLMINKNETILIHSRSNLEMMGLDLFVTVVQKLNKK